MARDRLKCGYIGKWLKLTSRQMPKLVYLIELDVVVSFR